ncbi:unnamed protein product [Adineta ricciae]|uniref:Uncharacterized protein n=1 Tax=Adineta ricciae TaxID=249248 RepID=A0A814M097_ADIRI|nr:unnamed protein product [Adineta ricciae]CAF1334016.1 unnamed protein product [Adineta ricciae]
MARFFPALLFLLQITSVFNSHFRGSMVTWRVINSTTNPLQVEVLQRHAWNYAWWPCTNAQISAGNYTIGSGILKCMSSCPPNVSTLNAVTVPCTGFNQIEQYVSGEGRFTFQVSPNYRFRAIFSGSAWFALVTGGGNWSIAVEINTYLRPNGRYNQAPIVTMLPIIRLRRFLTYNIKINVADNDFDRYKCIWSNTSDECGGICRSVLSLPASTYLNETSCVLRFTPATVGFYAMAFTVLDYENDTSIDPLSRVPVQFIFNVWDSNITCSTPPIYIGDAPADQCIFVEPGQIITMIIRIRVQCANATLVNVIGVYPTGFTQSAVFTDSYDLTLYNFKVSYSASANQVGQNLFCFAGVDSIGNQGDATCLRFTVQLGSDSRNTLYVNNATHFPTGLVSKYQSSWTILYPSGITYSRPNTDAFVRFKLATTNTDFVTYNVLKQPDNVIYHSDRLEIISDITFSTGQQFYISIDSGVFLPIATCLRDSMGITDSTFWTFYTAVEPSTSTTTSTTTTFTTVTIQNRTIPTIRTIPPTLPATTSAKRTTIEFSTTTAISTTNKNIFPTSSYPVSTAVGATIGAVIVITLMSLLIHHTVKRYRTKSVVKLENEESKTETDSDTSPQYRLTTRTAAQPASKANDFNVRDIVQLTTAKRQNLIVMN